MTTIGDPGDAYSQKLNVFDTYVSYVRAKFPAFGYSKLNWDSVATYYRSNISDSTSKGAFSALLCNLSFELNDMHAYACDNDVEQTPLNPGCTPFVTLPFEDRDVSRFGAALTLLPDKSLLVYKVVPNHPLGLQPGDIVVGYEGIPWSQLIEELIDGGMATGLQIGACKSAIEYHKMVWAGICWHLFDTIDIKKYGTDELVHLPTAPLMNLNKSIPLLQSDQLPIPGVPMPSEVLRNSNVTYGIVDGTNVGYIYVRHHRDPKISTQFDAAVKALENTNGLIIDLRMSLGGKYGLEKGIATIA